MPHELRGQVDAFGADVFRRAGETGVNTHTQVAQDERCASVNRHWAKRVRKREEIGRWHTVNATSICPSALPALSSSVKQFRLYSDAMCNRYTPSDREDPHFRTWLAINPSSFPPTPWRKIGPWQTGPFFANAPERRVDWKVGQWGLIRPNNPRRWDYVGKKEETATMIAAGKEPKRRSTNNARNESMRKSPVFGPAWRAGKRCIIPAASFDEPCWETGKNVWWEFARADGKPWGIAGLWNEWTDPDSGEVVPNFSMITLCADSHPLMSRMHRPEYESDGKTLKVEQDKRSILVMEPADWSTWLFGSEDEALSLLKLPPAETFDAGPVGSRPAKQKSMEM